MVELGQIHWRKRRLWQDGRKRHWNGPSILAAEGTDRHRLLGGARFDKLCGRCLVQKLPDALVMRHKTVGFAIRFYKKSEKRIELILRSTTRRITLPMNKITINSTKFS